jgi:hypothetical protein
MDSIEYYLDELQLQRIKNQSVIVELTLDRNDELWDERQDLGTAMPQHVLDPLLYEELVWMRWFTEAFEEHGKITVVIKFLNVYLAKKLFSKSVKL